MPRPGVDIWSFLGPTWAGLDYSLSRQQVDKNKHNIKEKQRIKEDAHGWQHKRYGKLKKPGNSNWKRYLDSNVERFSLLQGKQLFLVRAFGVECVI